jgi:L-methionine (R)-S-oxide reductase
MAHSPDSTITFAENIQGESMALTMRPEALLDEVRKILDRSGTIDPSCEQILEKLLEAFDCQVGTIHSLDPDTGMLKLRARRGIPDVILDKVRMIPIGKGMAGIAAERKQAVQVCNLQTDSSGVAKPGAKETQMEGSVAAPMLVDGKLRGTLGVAKPVAYEFTKEEMDTLMAVGSLVASYLK